MQKYKEIVEVIWKENEVENNEELVAEEDNDM